ncbi:MAG TPA: FkbM family methyltransferase [Allosphingosinicella sp.]|jgi:FkbM family methyltransferase
MLLGVKTLTIGHLEVKVQPTSAENLRSMTVGQFSEIKLIQRTLERSVRSGDVVADVGAHTGLWSIPLAMTVGPGGAVYAFEPEPATYSALQRNIELNSLGNVTSFPIALSDRTGAATLNVRGDTELHSFYETTVEPFDNARRETIAVTVDRLDLMLGKKNLVPPTFMKIDVEGAELEVLKGAEGIIRSLRTILVEVHEEPLRAQGLGICDITGFLEAHDFSEAAGAGDATHLVYRRSTPTL